MGVVNVYYAKFKIKIHGNFFKKFLLRVKQKKTYLLTTMRCTFRRSITVHSNNNIRRHYQIRCSQLVILQAFLLLQKKIITSKKLQKNSIPTSCSVVSDAKPEVSSSGSSDFVGTVAFKLLLLLLFWICTTGFFFISLLFAVNNKHK